MNLKCFYINLSTTEVFLKLRDEKAEEWKGTIATNTKYWYNAREAQKRGAGIYEVSANVHREAQMDATM